MLEQHLFRPSLLSDFTTYSYERLGQSSYKQAAFPLGCSSSEFEMSFDGSEITLLRHDLSVAAFLRIRSAAETNLFFDLFCVAEIDDCVEPLHALMNHLLEKYAVNKLFSQLLDHESTEQALLTTCGFEEEARLVEQVWLQGKYQDIIIMGGPLHV